MPAAPKRSASGQRAGLGWLALAAAGGAGWALCFGRQPLVAAPWAAMAPLFLLLAAPRPGRLTWLHGVAFWLTSIPWIATTVASYGGLPGWLGVLLLLLLAAYLAAFAGLFGRLGAPVWRRGGALAVVGAAALWTALEWLRGWLLGGFPWNLAAYAWVDVPGATRLASWIGPYGVTFAVALANAGLARAVGRRRWAPWLWSAGAAVLLLSWAGRWAGPVEPSAEPRHGRPFRIVQPNIPIRSAGDAASIGADYGGLVAQSREACDVPGALILWPESAAWPFTWQHSELLRDDVASLAAAGCPVLLNSVRLEDGRAYNAVLVVDASGPAGRYDKRHLVPFGEHVPPWAAWLPGVEGLARAAGDFAAGSQVSLLPWAGERLGLSICFEVTFPEEVAATARAGATVLATVTNDAWYGDSSAPWQHFRAARFRAAENRRPMLRAALTGVSGWIAADGSVRARLGVGERGVLRGRVAGRADRTPYSRLPWLAPALAALLAAFAILRARREPEP